MALRIEYETLYGITCDYAHCIVKDARVNKEQHITQDEDGEEVVTYTFDVRYSGCLLYTSDAADE